MSFIFLAIVSIVIYTSSFFLIAALPGTLTLPTVDFSVVDGVTNIDDAVKASRASGLKGWELVEYAQHLTARKFTYSRRNHFDNPEQAFRRGYGYCLQQAQSLKLIYDRLGIQSRVVQSMVNCFPRQIVNGVVIDTIVSGHAWVQVTVDHLTLDVCPGSVSNRPGVANFVPLAEITPLSDWDSFWVHLSCAPFNIIYESKYIPRMLCEITGGRR